MLWRKPGRDCKENHEKRWMKLLNIACTKGGRNMVEEGFPIKFLAEWPPNTGGSEKDKEIVEM